MAVLSTKIPQFVNRAVTKCRIMATDLLEEFDPQGYQSESAADLQLKLYETRQFLKLLTGTEDYGGMTAKEISDNIDFFTSWLQLNRITAVNYLHYTMPIQGSVIVQPGAYALQMDLTSEIQARVSADASLSNRITALEENYFTPESVFPDDFWDNYEGDYSVVFDDDDRLHTHSNKSDLDNITTAMVTALSGLQTHYASVNGPSSLHVTTAERASWNARITSLQLSTALSGYSQNGHTHTINQVIGLEDVINGINQDIIDMAAEPGEDGREAEFQMNGDNLEWRYVGDATWIDLGVVKGDEGPEFTIDVRGPSNQRFNSLYDNEGSDFSYLETDTGYLYLREPGGGLATVPAGWSVGIKFTGDNGWSPVLGAYEYTASRVVQEIVDWTGGVGTKPVFDAGVSPPNPIRWFIGPNGPTLDPNQAINIKGPTGNGHGPIIGAVGAIAGRTAYDGASIGFIYMRNDVSPQTIFVKQSDASADWSAELPWQGPAGLEGAAPNSITNAMLRQSAALSVIGRSANSTGDVADIAGTDGQLLRVAGTTLGFGNNGLNALMFNNNQGIDVVASGGSDVLNIGTSNADVINIGWSGSVVNITGSLSYQNVTNLEVTDKLIRINKGGAAASGVSSGFEIEENAVVTGYFATNGTRDGWDFKAPAIAGVATFSQASLTGARTYTLPDASGILALESSSSFWKAASGVTLTGTNTISGAFEVDYQNTSVRFRNSQILLNNPANTFYYIIASGAISASRTLTLPAVAGNRLIATMVSSISVGRIPFATSTAGDLSSDANFTYVSGLLATPTVVVGGTSITAGSVLADYQSTTLGVLMPRVTNIASVATPVAGMIAYDAATNKFNFRENTTWVQLGGGSGDVVGPGSATDNALARFDTTTGKLIQNGTATLDDNGNISLGLSSIAGGRTLNVVSSDADASLTINSKGNGAINFGTTSNSYGQNIIIYNKNLAISHNSNTDVQEAFISLYRGRGTSASSPSTIANGDYVGRIDFTSYDGNSDVSGAWIRALVNGTVSDNVVPTDLVFYTGQGTPTERFRITSQGNISLVGLAPSNWQSSEKVLFIGNRTADPSAAIANGIALYSKDSSDGSANSTLALFTEQAMEAIGSFSATHKLKFWHNNVEYRVAVEAV